MSTMKESSFFESPSGITEHFITLQGEPGSDFRAEVEALLARYHALTSEEDIPVFVRFHLSDITTQESVLKEYLTENDGFISFIGQAPCNNSRISLEAYHVRGSVSTRTFESDDSIETLVALTNYRLFYYRRNKLEGIGSGSQMREEFESLKERLAELGGTVADNTHRTWIYCRDVDNNYADLVEARKDFFNHNHLTAAEHFIASTGIQGVNCEPSKLVSMDSLSVFGHAPEQVEYMKALDFLSNTNDYGVTFERGTRIIYGDRSAYYISGTASIDSEGKVLHIGDVRKQTQRTLENINALMTNHGGALSDLKQAVVYLRDASDAPIVEEELRKSAFSDIPYIMVKAPVCRPTWLVEIDAIGVNNNGDCNFAPLC